MYVIYNNTIYLLWYIDKIKQQSDWQLNAWINISKLYLCICILSPVYVHFISFYPIKSQEFLLIKFSFSDGSSQQRKTKIQVILPPIQARKPFKIHQKMLAPATVLGNHIWPSPFLAKPQVPSEKPAGQLQFCVNMSLSRPCTWILEFDIGDWFDGNKIVNNIEEFLGKYEKHIWKNVGNIAY